MLITFAETLTEMFSEIHVGIGGGSVVLLSVAQGKWIAFDRRATTRIAGLLTNAQSDSVWGTIYSDQRPNGANCKVTILVHDDRIEVATNIEKKMFVTFDFATANMVSDSMVRAIKKLTLKTAAPR